MTRLSKLASAPAATPRKGRRMANVLDVVLKSSKVPTPVSTKASEDKVEELGEVAAVSASPTYVEARPLGTKPVEQAKEGLLEKLTSHIPEHLLKPIWIYCSPCFRETIIGRANCRSAILCKGPELSPRVLSIWRK
jgi:hypothetical protein